MTSSAYSGCLFCAAPSTETFQFGKTLSAHDADLSSTPTLDTLKFLCQIMELDFPELFIEAQEEGNVSISFCFSCAPLFLDIHGQYLRIRDTLKKVRGLVLSSNTKIGEKRSASFSGFGGSPTNSGNLKRFRRQICAQPDEGATNSWRSDSEDAVTVSSQNPGSICPSALDLSYCKSRDEVDNCSSS